MEKKSTQIILGMSPINFPESSSTTMDKFNIQKATELSSILEDDFACLTSSSACLCCSVCYGLIRPSTLEDALVLVTVLDPCDYACDSPVVVLVAVLAIAPVVEPMELLLAHFDHLLASRETC